MDLLGWQWTFYDDPSTSPGPLETMECLPTPDNDANVSYDEI